MQARTVALAVLGWVAAACGPSAPTGADAPVPAAPVSHDSGTSLERFFPLEDSHIYQYAVESDNGADTWSVRVKRHDGSSGSLQLPGGTKQFAYARDGIQLTSRPAGPVYVLKAPLSLGNSWRGEFGGNVEIVEVDAAVNVPAGSYAGCVKTVESRGGDRPVRVATTFCPDVGIVLLEAASGAQMERAALTAYGPPVDLGPDGVRQIK
jgi:hypothetical protein